MSSPITVDTHQDLANDPRVETTTLKYGDYRFTNVEGLTVLVEEKRLSDLISSWRSRRLQRQLRGLLKANPDGLNILALRASDPTATLSDVYVTFWNAEISLDLLKWQALGGMIGVLPWSRDAALATLESWHAVLHNGRHLLSVLAGDDRDAEPRERMTPCALALRKVFKGVGYKTANAWAKAAKQSLTAALTMSEDALAKAGVNTAVRAQLHTLTGGSQ